MHAPPCCCPCSVPEAICCVCFVAGRRREEGRERAAVLQSGQPVPTARQRQRQREREMVRIKKVRPETRQRRVREVFCLAPSFSFLPFRSFFPSFLPPFFLSSSITSHSASFVRVLGLVLFLPSITTPRSIPLFLSAFIFTCHSPAALRKKVTLHPRPRPSPLLCRMHCPFSTLR